MSIRAILFDLDDTLVDTAGTLPLRARRIAEMLSQHVEAFDAELFVQRALAKNEASDGVVGTRPLLRELGLEGTALGDLAREMWFFQGCRDLVRSFPGAAEAIRALGARYALGIVSNGYEVRQRNKIAGLEFGEGFRVVVTSERAGIQKPAREIFELAARELGLLTSECVFVGDNLVNDVIGATQAGMEAIWFNQGHSSVAEAQAGTMVVESFHELSAVIEKLQRA